MKTIINTTALKDCLVYNNRFGSGNITAAQIGAEDFAQWKTLVSSLHMKAYKVYEALENHAPTAELKSDVFTAVKDMLDVMGDLTLTDKDGNIHGASIVIDDEFADAIGELCAKYAGKLGNNDAPDLQFCLSQKRNAENLLKQYEKTAGVNPEAIENLNEEIERLDAQKSELLKTPDMRVKKPVIGSYSNFVSNFERHLARTIMGQKAQSWEEYEAAKEAKRQARRAATKAKKQAKAKEQANAQ